LKTCYFQSNFELIKTAFYGCCMALKILIAPSGFKESLDADEVAACIEKGILAVLPDAKTKKAPLVDGGEGFTRALVKATGGSLHHVTVTGPIGKPVEAHFGFLGGSESKTAVLEMASAAGLHLIPEEARNPLSTSTYGVGELIRAALDRGAEKLLIGCGDSGTNDGGAGMAQALGIRLQMQRGKIWHWVGASYAVLRTSIHPDVTTVLKKFGSMWPATGTMCCADPRGSVVFLDPRKGHRLKRLKGSQASSNTMPL
jgi:glycerate kinase